MGSPEKQDFHMMRFEHLSMALQITAGTTGLTIFFGFIRNVKMHSKVHSWTGISIFYI